MVFKKNFLSTLTTTMLVVCFLATMGAAKGVKPIADVNIGTTGISWQPKVNYGSLVLNISRPDGSVFSKTFKAGISPYFDLSENNGVPFADGSYTYELRVIPVVSKKIRGADDDSREGRIRPPKTLTQTGYFWIQGGGIVTPQGDEDGANTPLDQVISDDLIVDGSLCVGNDCYSGLAFGFDTIVLMENNLRIFFDDTSTIQNYPRNDWRIIANDSTDSGGNYFAIEDATEVSNILVLEAGAPDNSLYVDSHGDVGINTSTPYYELHIVDGDSPCVRLDQDGSYGWTPQKWDLCGNESNFFIRDATHASKLPFRIEPDAPTDSIFVSSDGEIGLGTGSPTANLEVEDTGSSVKLLLDRTDGATAEILAKLTNTSFGSKSNHAVQFTVNSSTKMVIDTAGDVGIGNTSPGYLLTVGTSGAYCDGGAWVPGSSRAYKENIQGLTLEEATAALEGLDPVKYNYKTNTDEDYIGFIAEDVPELVATRNRKGVNPMDVVAVLTKVLKQQQTIISELENRIAKLEKKN